MTALKSFRYVKKKIILGDHVKILLFLNPCQTDVTHQKIIKNDLKGKNLEGYSVNYLTIIFKRDISRHQPEGGTKHRSGK